MNEDSAEKSAVKSKVSRRDFLKISGVGTGAFLISNSLIGEYLSNLNPEINPVKDALSEYKIAWQARPWVWINLAIASDKLDGTVIPPGKEISVNNLLGFDKMQNVSRENTDPQKGFIAAQMSDPAKLDGWGYGLCLGSTAIFRASLESPLLITKRGTHYDIYSDYFKDMPIGTDAAIFKPDPGDNLPETDLKLKNPTNFPLKLSFRIYDEFGQRLKPPSGDVSQLWYKASYLDQLVRVLRRKVDEKTGVQLPNQYLPEYTFGNKKIIVQSAIGGNTLDYSVNLSPVKHGASTMVNGIQQYAFSRELILRENNEEVKNYTENFISQYR
jgi:hypothetical protein